jgi:hypothetical protein
LVRPAAGIAATLLVLVAIHVVISRGIPVPFTYADEQGYLANARYLAGFDAVPQIIDLPFYHAGYSLLVAPLYVLLGSPSDVYQGVILLNAVLASLGVLPLYALARELLGLARWRAVLAAAAASAYPAYLVMANGAWSDVLFVPLFSLFVLLMHRTARDGTWPAATGSGLSAAALYWTHPRGLLLAVIALVALAWCTHTHLLAARRAAAAATIAVVGTAAGMVLHARLREEIWDGRAADPSATAMVRRAFDPTEWAEIALRLAGQITYLTLASLGVWALGIALLARLAARRGPGDRAERARRLAAATILASVAVIMLLTSVGAAEAPLDERIDKLMYGRYTEGVSAAVLAAGLAALLGPGPRRVTLLRWGAAMAIACAGALAVYAAAGAGTFRDHRVIPVNIIGAIWFAGHGSSIEGFAFGRFVALALLAALAVAAVWRWRAIVAVALVGAVFVVSGADASRDYWVASAERVAGLLSLQLAVPAEANGAAIGLDVAADTPGGRTGYQFWLDRHQFEVFDSSRGEVPSAPLAIAPPDWADGRRAGGRVVAVETGGIAALWALPGPLLERLAATGRVFPSAPGEDLEPRAAVARLRVVEPAPGPIRVPSGGIRELEVEVTHAGTGSPWQQWTAGPGGVAALAAWYAGAGELVAHSVANLPRTLMPGDAVRLDIPLGAVDENGLALPPGRYRVVVAMTQVSKTPFAATPESSLELEVTVS